MFRKIRVYEEIIIIRVLLETHWRPPWTSRWRPPDSRCRTPYFHWRHLKTSIGVSNERSLGKYHHNWSTFGDPHGRLVGDPQIFIIDPIFSLETHIFSLQKNLILIIDPLVLLESHIISLETPIFSAETPYFRWKPHIRGPQ